LEISYNELKPKLIDFRNNNRSLITNYIYQDLSEQKIVFFYNENGLLFFIHDEDYDFYKMYFMVSSLNELDTLLNQVKLNKCITLELIKKNETFSCDLKELLAKNSFKDTFVLKRMSTLARYKQLNNLNEVIQYCSLEDVELLKRIFKNKFNKYSDRLPSKEEIQTAVKSKSIIKLFNNEELMGFLWFLNKTSVSELKYLFIDEKYRGQNLSKVLVDQYLHLTNDIKKKQLWVLSDNKKAISLYKKYGYSFEDLEDIIFVRSEKGS